VFTSVHIIFGIATSALITVLGFAVIFPGILVEGMQGIVVFLLLTCIVVLGLMWHWCISSLSADSRERQTSKKWPWT
jgi:hypothetical protein